MCMNLPMEENGRMMLGKKHKNTHGTKNKVIGVDTNGATATPTAKQPTETAGTKETTATGPMSAPQAPVSPTQGGM